jgi:hypothetical protein
MYRVVSPLPTAVTLYRQPRKTSDVKGVLPKGTDFWHVERVPDFPGWWSVTLMLKGRTKQGYIHLPTQAWHDGEDA